jgi:hypothetical protein
MRWNSGFDIRSPYRFGMKPWQSYCRSEDQERPFQIFALSISRWGHSHVASVFKFISWSFIFELSKRKRKVETLRRFNSYIYSDFFFDYYFSPSIHQMASLLHDFLSFFKHLPTQTVQEFTTTPILPIF